MQITFDVLASGMKKSSIGLLRQKMKMTLELTGTFGVHCRSNNYEFGNQTDCLTGGLFISSRDKRVRV